MKNDFLIIVSIFLCLTISSLLSSLWAQQTQTISGVIIDMQTEKPVSFANISVKDFASGSISDSTGHFLLEIRSDVDVELVVSHINYHKKEFSVSKQERKHLNIELEPKISGLTEVVVSATLSEQPIQKSTKSVSLVTQRQIHDNMGSNMVDVLSRTPGFAQVWEYHSPLLLRGMNSNRLLVLKNGNRRIGTFPGGYFGQDLNIYEAKKIEIIKGPGSVIYGSGAISGIINVITPEPFGTKETNVKVFSGYATNNNEFIEGLNFCHKTEKFGIQLHGKWRKTDAYLYGNGQEAENSQVEDKDLSLTTGYRFSLKHKVTLHADYHLGDWGKPRGFNGPEKYFTEIKNEEEGVHSAISYNFSSEGFIKNLSAKIYYDAGSRDYFQYKHSEVTGKRTSLDLVHYKDYYGGGQFFSTMNLFQENMLTVGVEGYFFSIDSPTDYYDYYNNTYGTTKGYLGAGQQNAGVFINDQWQVSSKVNIVAGTRFDGAQVTEGNLNGLSGRNESRTAVSGNLGLVYSFAEGKSFSGNIGRAFRMPITEELFTETVSCKGIKKGNPDLEPEYSWNFDAGFRGTASNNKINWEIALFYNIVDDYIGEIPDTINEDVDFTYKNTDAVLLGGEASFSYRFDGLFKPENNLYSSLSLSHTYGVDKSSNEENRPLFGIPPFKLLADIKYRGLLNKSYITGYSLSLEGEYAAAQNRIGDIPEGVDGGPWGYETSNAHTAFNFLLGLNSNSLPGQPKLRFVVKNILDDDYKPFGSYLPVMGRNFKFLLSFTF